MKTKQNKNKKHKWECIWGRERILGMRNPFKQAKCVCSWDSTSHLMKEEIKTSCRRPFARIPTWVCLTQEWVRESRAAAFWVQGCFQNQSSLQSNNPCRSCLNTFNVPPVKTHCEPIGHALWIIPYLLSLSPPFFRHALELWAGAVLNTLFILGEENVFL